MQQDLILLKEALEYVVAHRGKTFVIKLGRTVIERLPSLGIVTDIKLLKDMGVNIIITHDIPEVICIEQLISAKYGKNRNNVFDAVRAAFEGIPMYYCCETEGASCDEVVASIAVENKAEKLIYLTPVDGIFANAKGLVSDMTVADAKKLAEKRTVTGGMRDKLLAAILACEHNVPRVHIINGTREGTLLTELFTCKGSGTMVFNIAPYHEVRKAEPTEFSDIADLLQTQDTFLTPVMAPEVISRYDQFFVFTVDHQVHGCMLMNNGTNATLEVAYLATSRAYEGSELVLKTLLEFAIDYASKDSVRRITLNPSKNPCWLRMQPWFYEMGFEKSLTAETVAFDHTKLWEKRLAA